VVADAPFIALQIVTVEGGVATVTWATSPVTAGVRLEYSVGSPGAAPSYATFTPDFAASLGAATLSGVAVAPGEEIVIRATPYDTFAAGVASGTAGEPRIARTTYLPDGFAAPAVLSASASIADPGECGVDPIGIAVNWSTVGTTTGLLIRVMASENGGAFALAADGLAVASNPYTDEITDFEVDPAGAPIARQYRIELYRSSDGSTVSTRTSATLNLTVSPCP
jgi:hypothetical protein